MSSILFNQSLNNFARKYLVKGNEYLIKDPNLFPLEYQKEIGGFGEQLLIHDTVSFKIYGENIPLSILINTFGIKGTEELLEQDAIRFMLWNPGVTYFVDDIPGLLPLQSMVHSTSSVHSDPEASIASGLNFLREPIPRRMRRDLTRKVAKKYQVPPEKLSRDAVEFGHTGYKQNLFAEMGLPHAKELTELSREEREKLCNLATQCLDISLLSMYQYSTYNSFDLLKLNRSHFVSLKDAKAVERVVDTVFEIENVPDFVMMISKGMLDIKEIPKFRKTKGSKQFRTWIDKVSQYDDKSDITKEYIDSVLNDKSFFQTPLGKLTRTMGVTTLGAVVGGAMAGPVGAISGTVVSNATDVGISLFDSYVLDNILKGWTPRHYIDKKIRPLVESQK